MLRASCPSAFGRRSKVSRSSSSGTSADFGIATPICGLVEFASGCEIGNGFVLLPEIDEVVDIRHLVCGSEKSDLCARLLVAKDHEHVGNILVIHHYDPQLDSVRPAIDNRRPQVPAAQMPA